MRITNRLGLPEAIVRAVQNDEYSPGDADISVSSLIDPPRKVALSKLHDHEAVEDASDRIWALLGRAVHSILEQANMNDLAEHRLYMDVLGWRVSGQFDSMTLTSGPAGETISDYKVVSSYEAKNGLKPERERQLNCYAELARVHGFDVSAVRAILILRDWSKLKAIREWDYPKQQICSFDVPLWSREKARAFMEERVRLHQRAQSGEMPFCTPEEMWERPNQWAVKVPGRKRATRLLDSREEAETYIAVNMIGQKAEIEFRPGERVRCNSYCSVSNWCMAHLEYLRQQRERAA